MTKIIKCKSCQFKHDKNIKNKLIFNSIQIDNKCIDIIFDHILLNPIKWMISKIGGCQCCFIFNFTIRVDVDLAETNTEPTKVDFNGVKCCVIYCEKSIVKSKLHSLIITYYCILKPE